MNISEILELTKTKPVAEIAKEYLTIGEKPTRAALKRAGCYTIVGQSGWYLDESENIANLDRSIYEIADELKAEKEVILKDRANLVSNKGTKVISNELDPIYRKRHSFDLDVALVKELKLYCVQNDITLYEAVEDAIKVYLDKEGLE